jgi:adenine deaminase
MWSVHEGSAAKNFNALESLIDEHYKMLMFCIDDRHPDHFYHEHINRHVKRALEKGHDLFKVLQIACVNPVTHEKQATPGNVPSVRHKSGCCLWISQGS